MKVLVVDNEPLVVELVAELLAGLGHRVWVASGMEDALEMAVREAPDLMLIDVRMDPDDGFMLLYQARSLAPETGVVLMSSWNVPGSRERALAAGALEYLPKPFTQAQIEGALRRALKTLRGF